MVIGCLCFLYVIVELKSKIVIFSHKANKTCSQLFVQAKLNFILKTAFETLKGSRLKKYTELMKWECTKHSLCLTVYWHSQEWKSGWKMYWCSKPFRKSQVKKISRFLFIRTHFGEKESGSYQTLKIWQGQPQMNNNAWHITPCYYLYNKN